MNPVARLDRVSVSYGGREVLHSVSTQLEAGQLAGMCGPNGAGKTTVVKLLLGLIAPDRGAVEVLGRDPVRDHRVRRHVGYLAQSARPDPRFPVSVRDLVYLGMVRSLAAWGGGAPQRGRSLRDSADFAMHYLGLAGLADRPIGALSGGELQLALVARAIAGRPRLLLLDEPLTALDHERKAAFYPLLRRWIAETGAAAIVVCHELEALTAHVDTLWCVDGTLHAHPLTPDAASAAERLLDDRHCIVDGVLTQGGRG